MLFRRGADAVSRVCYDPLTPASLAGSLMSMDLRPLALGELLDRSFSIYRRHFWLFVGIMAVPSILMLLISITIQLLQPANPALAESSPDGPQPSVEMLALFIGGALLVLVGLIVYWIAYAIATGAATVGVAQLYDGATVTIASAYAPVRGKAFAIAFLLFLVGLRIGGLMFIIGLILAVVGAGLAVVTPVLTAVAVMFGLFTMGALTVWMMLRYSVAVPALVLEGATATESIGRSIELTKGHLGRVFVVVLFCVLVTYAAMFIFNGPFMFAAVLAGPETTTAFWLNLAGAVFGSIANAFTGSLVIISLAVLYYDLRVRKEGLDLQVMISHLGRETTDAPAVLPG